MTATNISTMVAAVAARLRGNTRSSIDDLVIEHVSEVIARESAKIYGSYTADYSWTREYIVEPEWKEEVEL